MPLSQGDDRKTIASNIREFHQGDTYARTKREHGKRDADKQAVAVAMRMAKEARRKTIAGGR